MTSGTFTTHSIHLIFVDRSSRQRKELRNIEELADSIGRLGLINPPVITRDGELIAGERRWTACKLLGWTSIPVQFVDELDTYELKSIELEENLKRENLTWQEEVLALQELHLHKLSADPTWTQTQTAESIGLSPSSVSKQLAVAQEMNDEKIANADKFNAAPNLVTRSTERRKANATAGLEAAFADVIAPTQVDSSGDTETVPAEPTRVIPMLNVSFHDWQPCYAGPKFNLIHCDFPYGINVANSPRQNAALADYYSDGLLVYEELLNTLEVGMDNVVADSAHLVFWFSMDYYTYTVDRLTSMGWKVNPFPLIWHKSDNSGIAPDPQRWPRRTYETAFIASRGDRKLTAAGPRSNSFAHPGSRADSIHISEKPRAVLQHFLSMFCDEYSIVLDPTAGSGNAIKVCEVLGAMSALGLELSPEFWEVACANWDK